MVAPGNSPMNKTQLQLLKDFIDLVGVGILSDTDSKTLSTVV